MKSTMKNLMFLTSRIHGITYRQIVFVLLAAIAACANPVAPTGGPKDEDPPAVLRCEPESGTVNFNATEIRLWFKEYVQLKELQQQFLSSPPFNVIPEIRTRGKSVIIRLEEELLPNTTYTLYFGDAITDLNEGNPLSNYTYVFSTGPILDSMELSGKVVNAFNIKPEKEVLVFLYDRYEDSIPYKERPYYVSRSDKEGNYNFTHLRNIPYKIFALRDANANLLYDLPNEEIAFSDSLVLPHLPRLSTLKDQEPEHEHEPDEVHTPHIENDDTIAQHKNGGLLIENLADTMSANPEIQVPVVLRLFTEMDSTQRIVKSSRPQSQLVEIIFRLPVAAVQLSTIPPVDTSWRMDEWSQQRDTLWCWLQHLANDSLFIVVSGHKATPDTLEFGPVQVKNIRNGKASEDTKPASLLIQSNTARSGLWKHSNPVVFTFSEPVANHQSESIMVFEDSIQVQPGYRFIDSIRRRLQVEYPWKEATQYIFRLKDSTFTGIYGHQNDSIQFRFKTRPLSDYGNLSLIFRHPFVSEHFIIQLMDEKEVIFDQKIITSTDITLIFPYLMPGKYRVKAIRDTNINRRWDTGSYPVKVQPEQVYIYEKVIEVRANWDIEEIFDISEH